jgi:hypothetical protein
MASAPRTTAKHAQCVTRQPRAVQQQRQQHRQKQQADNALDGKSAQHPGQQFEGDTCADDQSEPAQG